jgi:alpha-amylase
VAPYQHVLPGVLSYPLFFTLRHVFMSQQSMYQLQTSTQQYKQQFRDVGLLASFVDNHDNARFLHAQSDRVLYRNALAYVLLAQGIPIVYYGTEQGFSGGNDPFCREPLWPTRFSTANAPLAHFLQQTVALRKKLQLFNATQTQRYADDSFYAFSRGTAVLVCTTNVGAHGAVQTRTLSFEPFADGTKLVNLYNASDVVHVSASHGVTVTLVNGEPKVYHKLL